MHAQEQARIACSCAENQNYTTGESYFAFWICRLLLTFLTPLTCDANCSARAFCSGESTIRYTETTCLVVSTSMRVKLPILSAASLVFTEAVIVESSTFWPAVSPVIAVQPAAESSRAIAKEPKIGFIV